jgi:hypothetical protein
MKQTNLLLNAYYEALYERLESGRNLLAEKIEKLLPVEIKNLSLDPLNREKYDAYRDACLAFIDERIEMYNPIGFQYTFDNIASPLAAELELHLNWYDAQAEFETLIEMVRAKTEAQMTDEKISILADELIKQLGAFPDNSIISAYRACPAPEKLPDYVLALAIEDIIR